MLTLLKGYEYVGAPPPLPPLHDPSFILTSPKSVRKTITVQAVRQEAPKNHVPTLQPNPPQFNEASASNAAQGQNGTCNKLRIGAAKPDVPLNLSSSSSTLVPETIRGQQNLTTSDYAESRESEDHAPYPNNQQAKAVIQGALEKRKGKVFSNILPLKPTVFVQCRSVF